ncbi:hypothetical protein Ahy_B04g073478 [Arachis hypogaea]|uniref:Uncharacterized protein n=1 Tax=Arachis hypogaea TaxID=3818 RepID=A0A444ZQG9_ARAHY|nr:hypothetical protein Ahy_B04g073478 [Arachis hypogaea]
MLPAKTTLLEKRQHRQMTVLLVLCRLPSTFCRHREEALVDLLGSAQFKPGSLEQDTDDSRIASPAAKSKVSAFSFIVSPPSRALNPPLHPNFDNVTQVFNFNYKPLTPYEGLTVQDGGEVRRWQRTVLLYFQIRGSKVPRLDSKIPNFLNLPFGGLVYTISFCIFQMVKEGVCCSQEVRAVERRVLLETLAGQLP